MTTTEHEQRIRTLFTVDETAILLRCHSRTVRKLLESGDLQRVNISKHAVRVTGASIRAFVERGGSAS